MRAITSSGLLRLGARRYSPLLPPDFLSRKTSRISFPCRGLCTCRKRERRDGGGSHRFHLHAGRRRWWQRLRGLRCPLDDGCFPHRQTKEEGVTHGNEFSGLFRRLNSCKPGDLQRIALGIPGRASRTAGDNATKAEATASRRVALFRSHPTM